MTGRNVQFIIQQGFDEGRWHSGQGVLSKGAERIRSQNNDFLLNMGRFVPAVRVNRTQSKGSTPVHVSQASFLLFGNFAPKCWANGDRRKHFERLYHLNGERYPCGYYCTLIWSHIWRVQLHHLDLNFGDSERSNSRALKFWGLIYQKGDELGHMLPLKISMEPYDCRKESNRKG